jgi:hypothetical protein
MDTVLTNLVKDYIANELKYNPPPEKELDGLHEKVPKKSRKERASDDDDYGVALQEW